MKDTLLITLIEKELHRQKQTINLIASENYTSEQVLAAAGSALTNKYAEGYPSKRYYAGCEIIDEIEKVAINRCKQLFGAEHANVQPHAGSQANMAAYFAVLQPRDTILGMSLAEGGHLTHGQAINFSGQLYNVIHYKVHPETELLDYDQIDQLAHIHKPKLIIAGASAYSRFIDFARFGAIAQSVGALLLADIAHIAGLVATGLHPHPFPYADIVTSTTHKTLRGPRGAIIMCKSALARAIDKAVMPGMQGGPFMNVIAAKAIAFYEALQPDFKVYQEQVVKNTKALAHALEQRNYRIVTNGTDNHLCIVDLRSKKITGKAAEFVLNTAGITVSRSCIPYDPEKPWITSGIRVGTPAVTTRGMKEKDMEMIAQYIDNIITNASDVSYIKKIGTKITEWCHKFPIY